MKYLFFMIWTGIVEQNVADHYQQRFSAAKESSGQGVVRCHIDMSFTHPLPESLLSSPKLLIVVANNSCVLFYFHYLTSVLS